MKTEDEIRLEFAKEELGYWKHRIREYEKAIKNGRCDECKEPLNFLEKRNGTCEDCLCPE